MKTALITGASSGIGKALATLMASKGIHLIITARRAQSLTNLQKELAAKNNIQITTIALDLTEPNAPKKLYKAIIEKNLKIDYLINNAGFGGQGYFHERKWEDEAAMMQLNIVVLTQLSHLFLPHFIKQGYGRILNVASSAGLIPGGPLQSVYFATKAYVLSFSQGLAGEMNEFPVTVTALCPGATKTEFSEVANLESTSMFSGKLFSAEQVAKDGYESMMKGELVRLTALTTAQKLNIKAIPFIPTKMILKQIKDMQKVK